MLKSLLRLCFFYVVRTSIHAIAVVAGVGTVRLHPAPVLHELGHK